MSTFLDNPEIKNGGKGKRKKNIRPSMKLYVGRNETLAGGREREIKKERVEGLNGGTGEEKESGSFLPATEKKRGGGEGVPFVSKKSGGGRLRGLLKRAGYSLP